MKMLITLNSIITCPVCGFSKVETMPSNSCQWHYDCSNCQSVLEPLEGDCCVFCSYATFPCPQVQAGATTHA